MAYRTAVKDSIRYGYAVGRVRVLEGRMLPSATYERLLDAATFREQMRVLSDTPYGKFLEGAEVAEDVERAFERALDELYGFLVTANLPDSVNSFFRTSYDYANLKARLKADSLGQSTEGLLVSLGTVLPERFAGQVGALPKRFRELYERLAGEGADVADEQVSTEIDRALFAELAMHAGASKSRFLAGLVALEIDLANVRTLLRARVRERKAAETRRLLIEGGNLDPERLMGRYSLPVSEMAGALTAMPGPFKGLHAEDVADLARYDVLADDIEVRYLKQARMVAAGPEPVIGYIMARQAEVMMVRTLLIGKMSGVPIDVLRRRLRQRYG
ncbi:MAG: V-type ATPase subunit [Coriobacteriia bacterium]|nr:V-type ATPase subunit [Coriobacteriia bacterium]